MKIMLVIESPNKGEALFSLKGPKNFFINTTSHENSKEGRMFLRIPKNASVCEGSLPVSTEVRTMLLVIEGVITTEEYGRTRH